MEKIKLGYFHEKNKVPFNLYISKKIFKLLQNIWSWTVYRETDWLIEKLHQKFIIIADFTNGGWW